MIAMEDLDQALASLDPQIEGRYVFAALESVPNGLEPFAVIREQQGLTVVASLDQAQQFGLDTAEPFTRITARAHTSLLAVGITATVTSTIASRGIPCNVIAGFYHDHFFVPADREEESLALMKSLAAQAAGWLPS